MFIVHDLACILSECSPLIERISKKRKQLSSSTIQNSLTCIQKRIAGYTPRTGRQHSEIKSHGFKVAEIYVNMRHIEKYFQLNWLHTFYYKSEHSTVFTNTRTDYLMS